MKASIQRLCATAVFTAVSFAAQASYWSLHELISSDCISAHSDAFWSGNSALMEEIAHNCPAARPGSELITPMQLDYTAPYYNNHYLGRSHPFSPGPSPISPFSSLNPIRSHGDASGLNAGDQFGNVGIWASASPSSVDNDLATTAFQSNNVNAAVGVDVMPWEGVVVGATFGYGNQDVNTRFNGGDQDVNDYTFAAYAAALLSANISIDASLGYANVDIDQERPVSAFEVAAGTPLAGAGAGRVASSTVDADRWFGSINVTGNWDFNHLLLNAHAGYLYVNEDHDSFTESATNAAGAAFSQSFASRDFDLGQVRVGGEVGYDFGSFLEPFAGLDYVVDETREDVVVAPGLAQPANDDDEVQFTFGMRYLGDNGVSAVLQYTGNALREDTDFHSLMFVLRADL
jgi:uncharacterized protein with beta-barrel porin domain